MNGEHKTGIGVSVAARELVVSENTVRRLCGVGIVRVARDSAGRRQLTQAQIDTLRAYLEQKRAA